MEKDDLKPRAVAGELAKLRIKRKVNPTEWSEDFIEGIREQGTTGTFLVTYRGGRPIRIREVNELTP